MLFVRGITATETSDPRSRKGRGLAEAANDSVRAVEEK